MDLAVLTLPGGGGWLGLGPFSEHATLPSEGAFYCNNFALSDPNPWKKPASLIHLQVDSELGGILSCGAHPEVRWVKGGVDGFKSVFRRIRRDVLAGGLEKMVPALTVKGMLLRGDLAELLEQVMKWGGRGWGYGYVRGESGFCGITPELLFQTDGRTLRTMALAGTAKPGADAAFLTDVKEIDEHELVVRYIENQLKGLGLVRREGRGLLETAGLRHFHTPIEVALKREVAAEELISLLHPTPAVGCMPRSEEWLLKLQEYRSQLAVPGFFGAPFGYCSGGGEMTMVVSIRGVGWAGGEVSLPSGCGIVAGSAFDHEWRELRLKRESVMNMLRL